MSGGKGGGVSGYRYFFSIHMGICRGPVDELVEIRVGDRRAWPLPITETTVDTTYDPSAESNWGSGPPG